MSLVCVCGGGDGVVVSEWSEWSEVSEDGGSLCSAGLV
jgi:hypothetical protein